VAVFLRVTGEPAPREVIRAVGTIIKAYDRPDIITQSLDIIWKQKP
jgi:hypothetical protein